MRAVKYGSTRHHVLGLEAVLASGEVIRTGGKFVKSSTGYDLTQLLVGSEGTLALVTEITVKIVPRSEHRATVLAPFGSLEMVTEAVPRIISSGVGPFMLEYIDAAHDGGHHGQLLVSTSGSQRRSARRPRRISSWRSRARAPSV